MVSPLNPVNVLHLCSAEFNAILVFLAMTCCGFLFVIPNASSYYEIGVFGLMWVLAQRAIACGGKYARSAARGVSQPARGTSDKGSEKPLKGTIVLMTGNERSFGFQAAQELAGPLGATVYLACQSKSEGTQAMGRILSKHPEATIHLLPEFDLTDFASIQRLVAAFRKQEKVLHVLINNAGILATCHKWTSEQKVPSSEATVDPSSSQPPAAGGGSSSSSAPVGSLVKFELHTCVNFLGPMLLTELLMPQLMLGTADAEKKLEERHAAELGNAKDSPAAASRLKARQAEDVAFTCRVINTASSSHLMIPYKDTSTRTAAGTGSASGGGSGKSKSSSTSASQTGSGSGDASPEAGRSLPLQRLKYLNDFEGKSPLGFKAVDFFKRYGCVSVYGLTKLAVIYATNRQSQTLRERCGHRCVSMCLHPGICATGLFDDMLPTLLGSKGLLFPLTRLISLLLMKTHWEAAQSILHCATTLAPLKGAGYKHFNAGSTLAANGYIVDCKDYGRGTGVSALSEMAQEPLASAQVTAWGLAQIKPWILSMQDHID